MICNIYVSEYAAGEWRKPKPLNDVNAAYGFTTTHPCIGEYKGKRSYFASNREGTVGGMDIWYSEVRNKGR